MLRFKQSVDGKRDRWWVVSEDHKTAKWNLSRDYDVRGFENSVGDVYTLNLETCQVTRSLTEGGWTTRQRCGRWPKAAAWLRTQLEAHDAG